MNTTAQDYLNSIYLAEHQGNYKTFYNFICDFFYGTSALWWEEDEGIGEYVLTQYAIDNGFYYFNEGYTANGGTTIMVSFRGVKMSAVYYDHAEHFTDDPIIYVDIKTIKFVEEQK